MPSLLRTPSPDTSRPAPPPMSSRPSSDSRSWALLTGGHDRDASSSASTLREPTPIRTQASQYLPPPNQPEPPRLFIDHESEDRRTLRVLIPGHEQVLSISYSTTPSSTPPVSATPPRPSHIRLPSPSNASHSSFMPQPGVHPPGTKVLLLHCHCGTFISNRGRKSEISFSTPVTIYSTDMLPLNCSATAEAAADDNPLLLRHSCECLNQVICCHGCGNAVGYMIVLPCGNCTREPGYSHLIACGHRFILYSDLIQSSERRYIHNEPGTVPRAPVQRRATSYFQDAYTPSPLSSSPSSSSGESASSPSPPSPSTPADEELEDEDHEDGYGKVLYWSQLVRKGQMVTPGAERYDKHRPRVYRPSFVYDR